MIGILIVCHGNLADGLINGMEMIIGKSPKIRSIGLYEGDAIDDLPGRIKQEIEKLKCDDGILIFVDIVGASPFNASARVIHELPNHKLSLITGVNLPMLLETALKRGEALPLEEMSRIIKEIGKDQIKTLSDIIR